MVQLTMGQKFAFGAGAAYIFSFLFGAVARVLVSTVSTPNMDRVRAAQPGERMAVFKTRGDLHDTNSDGIPLIKEMLFRDETSQSYAVVEGMILGVAALLGIAALLSLKTQMSMKRDSDEQELLMMTAFVIGFTIPMLQFCMQAGPRSMVGWIGADAVAASVCEGITEESVCTVTAAKFSDALVSVPQVRRLFCFALPVFSFCCFLPFLSSVFFCFFAFCFAGLLFPLFSSVFFLLFLSSVFFCVFAFCFAGLLFLLFLLLRLSEMLGLLAVERHVHLAKRTRAARRPLHARCGLERLQQLGRMPRAP
eukprot:SAG31_NODE_1180_length_9525_cov_4.989497_1_plen_308_part_00